MAEALDQTAQTLFLTEMMRGLSLTLRMFFDKKVTVGLLSNYSYSSHFPAVLCYVIVKDKRN